MKRYQTSSAKETMEIGQRLGEALLRMPATTSAVVVTLSGELGAGKTTLTKGIYKGLGSKAPVTSPTFIIMRHTHVKAKKTGQGKSQPRYKTLVHVDAYRLREPEALQQIGFADVLGDPLSLVIIEWPERAGNLIPKKAISITLAHGKDEHARSIAIKGITIA